MVIMVLLYQANNKHEVPRIDYIEAYNHMNDQEIYIEDQEIINKIKEVMKSGFALPGLADMEVPADLELKLVYSDQTQVKIGFYTDVDAEEIRMVDKSDSEKLYYVVKKWVTFMVETFYE